MDQPPARSTRRGRACIMAGALATIISACERSPDQPASSAPGASAATGAWREFTGSWNASGTRRTLALGADRTSAIVDVRGSMLLTGEGRPAVGFRADVVGLSDTATGFVGRSVWTDEQGDTVLSELKGEGTKEHNRIVGTIIGGTGRYEGVTGTFEFSWQYMLEAEDGTIRGRATDLKGRVRIGQPAAPSGGANP